MSEKKFSNDVSYLNALDPNLNLELYTNEVSIVENYPDNKISETEEIILTIIANLIKDQQTMLQKQNDFEVKISNLSNRLEKNAPATISSKSNLFMKLKRSIKKRLK